MYCTTVDEHFIDFIVKNYPWIANTVDRANIPFDSLKIGSKLISLRHIDLGAILVVASDPYLTRFEDRGVKTLDLKRFDEVQYDQTYQVCEFTPRESNWFINYMLLSEAEFDILKNKSFHARERWLDEKLGCKASTYYDRMKTDW